MENFTQIRSSTQLLEVIEQIHISCYNLCNRAVGKYLPIAGNIAVFCHFEDEFAFLTSIREKVTEPSDNPNQKYYRLRKPITISANGNIPKATYTHLYIRQPDPTPNGRYTGDIDFVLGDPEYASFKALVQTGAIKDAKIYDRAGWDMIEVSSFNERAVAYISTKTMAEKIRIRF